MGLLLLLGLLLCALLLHFVDQLLQVLEGRLQALACEVTLAVSQVFVGFGADEADEHLLDCKVMFGLVDRWLFRRN